MSADNEQPVDTARLRKFDQNLMETGSRLAHRVVEPVPFCWFCANVAGTRSKEHIFPQWLLKHHGAMDERVHPIRISMPLGGAVASERGERPLRAHFNGEVCSGCNNGWMSSLEMAVMPVLTQSSRSGHMGQDEATILARWFAKTAVNLNVSQPFRLLVDRPSRHELATGIPARFAVHLFRVRKQNGVFDWVQKSPDTASCPQSQIERVLRLTELTLVTHIRVADLVAVVVHAPEHLSPTDMIPTGTTRIYPLPDRLPSWEELPIHDDYLGPFTHMDLL